MKILAFTCLFRCFLSEKGFALSKEKYQQAKRALVVYRVKILLCLLLIMFLPRRIRSE